MAIDHIIRHRKANWPTQQSGGGSPAMTMMHLNSQAQQFGGFTPGQRVFGRTPKMPTGAVSNPHFTDFMNPKDARTTKTHHLLGIIHQIRQASSTADFNGKLTLRINRRLRQSTNGGFS